MPSPIGCRAPIKLRLVVVLTAAFAILAGACASIEQTATAPSRADSGAQAAEADVATGDAATSEETFTIAVVGDIVRRDGNGGSDGEALKLIRDNLPDAFISVGDEAYNTGSGFNYQYYVKEGWGGTCDEAENERRKTLWPVGPTTLEQPDYTLAGTPRIYPESDILTTESDPQYCLYDRTFPTISGHDYLTCDFATRYRDAYRRSGRRGVQFPGSVPVNAQWVTCGSEINLDLPGNNPPNFWPQFWKTRLSQDGINMGDAQNNTYYSFDLPSKDKLWWHFTVLNTHCNEIVDADQNFLKELDGWSASTVTGSCGPDGAEYKWLKQDLDANNTACTAAVSHHPRYSSDSHHGSSGFFGYMWGLMVGQNVDIALSGHAHIYERFQRMGEQDRPATNGIVQWIVGTGGKLSDSEIKDVHAGSESHLTGTPAVLFVTLTPSTYSWKLLAAGGAVKDQGGPVNCNNVSVSGEGCERPLARYVQMKVSDVTFGCFVLAPADVSTTVVVPAAGTLTMTSEDRSCSLQTDRHAKTSDPPDTMSLQVERKTNLVYLVPADSKRRCKASLTLSRD